MKTKSTIIFVALFIVSFLKGKLAVAAMDDLFPPIEGFDHSPIANYNWDPPSGIFGAMNPLYIVSILFFLIVIFMYRFGIMVFDFGKNPSFLYDLLDNATKMVTTRLWDIVLYLIPIFILIVLIFIINDYRRGNIANIGKRTVNFLLAMIITAVVASMTGATIIKLNEASQLLGEQISNKISGNTSSNTNSLYSLAWKSAIEDPFGRGEIGDPELAISDTEASQLSAKINKPVLAGTKWTTLILSYPPESEARLDIVSSFEDWHEEAYDEAFSSSSRFLTSLFVLLVGVCGFLFFIIFGLVFLLLFLLLILVVLSAMVFVPMAYLPSDKVHLLMKWGKYFLTLLVATLSVQIYVTFIVILIDLVSSVDLFISLKMFLLAVVFLLGILIFLLICTLLFKRTGVQNSYRRMRNRRGYEYDDEFEEGVYPRKVRGKHKNDSSDRIIHSTKSSNEPMTNDRVNNADNNHTRNANVDDRSNRETNQDNKRIRRPNGDERNSKDRATETVNQNNRSQESHRSEDREPGSSEDSLRNRTNSNLKEENNNPTTQTNQANKKQNNQPTEQNREGKAQTGTSNTPSSSQKNTHSDDRIMIPRDENLNGNRDRYPDKNVSEPSKDNKTHNPSSPRNDQVEGANRDRINPNKTQSSNSERSTSDDRNLVVPKSSEQSGRIRRPATLGDLRRNIEENERSTDDRTNGTRDTNSKPQQISPLPQRKVVSGQADSRKEGGIEEVDLKPSKGSVSTDDRFIKPPVVEPQKKADTIPTSNRNSGSKGKTEDIVKTPPNRLLPIREKDTKINNSHPEMQQGKKSDIVGDKR